MIEKYVSYSHGITLPNHDLFPVFYKHTLRRLSIQAAALQVVEGRIYWGVVNRTYIIYRCYWPSM